MPPEQLAASSQPESNVGSATSSGVTSQATILRTEEEVAALLRESRNFFRPLRIRKIGISFEGLSAPTASELEVRLNSHLRECGCQSGSVVAAIGLVAYVALLTFIVGSPSAWEWRHLFIGIGLCLGLATVGKLMGLFRARVRLVRELQWLWQICRDGKPCRTGE